jgi:hypothetical protein
MRRAERVVFAFARLVKPESRRPARSVRMRSRAAGQDLVRIGLVANVPDQPVAWACRRRNAAPPSARPRQARAEMPAGHGNRIDHLGA